VIWSSKSPRRFFGLSLNTKQASVCRLRHKTDGGGWHETRVEIGRHASAEASRARVFQSGLKTGGGVTAGGARGTITKVASGSS
jgi:hypothetical protein